MSIRRNARRAAVMAKRTEGESPPPTNLAAAWTGLTEEDLQLGDVERDADKAQRFHSRNDQQAMELQVNHKYGR